MNTVTSSRQFKNYTVDPGGSGDPNCPPDDNYIIRFVDILDLDYAKQGYDGNEPKLQYKLAFELDNYEYLDDKTNEIKQLWAWFTTKIHAIPGYPEPHLYKLVKAVRGGEPYPMPRDADGLILPYDTDFITPILEENLDKRFKADVERSARGYPQIDKDTIKALPARRATATATKVVNVSKVVEETEEEGDDVDNNF